MRILITGGAGFIGANLLINLKRRYRRAKFVSYDALDPMYPVAGVEYVRGDVLDLAHLKQVTTGADRAFHLAAEIGTHEGFDAIDAFVRANILGTTNMLECARRNGFPLLVASKPNVWSNPYSATKECAEKFVAMYQREYGIKAIVIKWFSVYGPRQSTVRHQKAVAHFVVSALKNQPLIIYGDGEQRADFVYVDDAVLAADDLLNLDTNHDTIQYGTGNSTRVLILAETVLRMTKSRSQVQHVPMRRGEELGANIVADMAASKKLRLHQPETSLEEGLAKTIRFYKKHL